MVCQFMPSESVLQCTNDVGFKLLFSLYIKKYLIQPSISSQYDQRTRSIWNAVDSENNMCGYRYLCS